MKIFQKFSLTFVSFFVAICVVLATIDDPQVNGVRPFGVQLDIHGVLNRYRCIYEALCCIPDFLTDTEKDGLNVYLSLDANDMAPIQLTIIDACVSHFIGYVAKSSLQCFSNPHTKHLIIFELLKYGLLPETAKNNPVVKIYMATPNNLSSNNNSSEFDNFQLFSSVLQSGANTIFSSSPLLTQQQQSQQGSEEEVSQQGSEEEASQQGSDEETSQQGSDEEASQQGSDEETSQHDSNEETSQHDSNEETSQQSFVQTTTVQADEPVSNNFVSSDDTNDSSESEGFNLSLPSESAPNQAVSTGQVQNIIAKFNQSSKRESANRQNNLIQFSHSTVQLNHEVNGLNSASQQLPSTRSVPTPKMRTRFTGGNGNNRSGSNSGVGISSNFFEDSGSDLNEYESLCSVRVVKNEVEPKLPTSSSRKPVVVKNSKPPKRNFRQVGNLFRESAEHSSTNAPSSSPKIFADSRSTFTKSIRPTRVNVRDNRVQSDEHLNGGSDLFGALFSEAVQQAPAQSIGNIQLTPQETILNATSAPQQTQAQSIERAASTPDLTNAQLNANTQVTPQQTQAQSFGSAASIPDLTSGQSFENFPPPPQDTQGQPMGRAASTSDLTNARWNINSQATPQQTQAQSFRRAASTPDLTNAQLNANTQVTPQQTQAQSFGSAASIPDLTSGQSFENFPPPPQDTQGQSMGRAASTPDLTNARWNINSQATPQQTQGQSMGRAASN